MRRIPIRDLLWLVVVIGLAVGWWHDRQRLAAERDDMANKLIASQLSR